MPETSQERFAYLERVESAARSYVDLLCNPGEGPGYLTINDVTGSLAILVGILREMGPVPTANANEEPSAERGAP